MFVMLFCMFIAALWSTAGKGLSCVCGVFIVFLSLSVWCPGSGVVLDCIDFRFLPP